LTIVVIVQLAPFRSRAIYDLAEEQGIPLVAVVPSKPKSRVYANLKFNIYNGINTGLLFARGRIVTFLMGKCLFDVVDFSVQTLPTQSLVWTF
jgi:hypothetical protein